MKHKEVKKGAKNEKPLQVNAKFKDIIQLAVGASAQKKKVTGKGKRK